VKISVVGTGYVGLVTGACLAHVGNEVVCVDIDAQKIQMLQQGVIPIHEPDLENIVTQGIHNATLSFTTCLEEGIAHAEIIFIAVGTPPDEDGSADLSYVLSVARQIGKHMSASTIVVNKSTVPVGTARRVRETIQEELNRREVSLIFDIVSNPEFLKEGAAVQDFLKPDRVVIGTDSNKARERMQQLYAPFNRNHDRVLFMDVPSAELTKYAANVMLATRISLMNELSNIAEQLGADIEAVRVGIGSDPRIGYAFIYPGCGYGGSCFPKDVRALIHTAKQSGYDAQILQAVEAVNERQKTLLEQKVVSILGEDLSGKQIAVWGLSFKPNTDDMRDAPSRTLMDALLRRGASILAHDPVAIHEATRIYAGSDHITFTDDPYAACANADALVICTEWQIYRSPDFQKIRSTMRHPLLIDGRNIYDPKEVAGQNIRYISIGRSSHPIDRKASLEKETF
jgi:UDPglucose 6-dehydrogenase